MSNAAASPPSSAAAALAAFLRRHPQLQGSRIALACSGGADSTALLWAARRSLAADQLLVLHVHHGLQPMADRFAEQVLRNCSEWGVDGRVLAVEVDAGPGSSLEEKAREARYAALAQAAHDFDCQTLLLGHQADDQAETLLLALLRGAGVSGLAAMPELTRRHGLWLGRPLLELAGDALRQQLRQAGVDWLDDPMNADPGWRRVAIRQQLLPALAQLEPAWRSTLGRSARLCAQAAAIVAERAEQDVQDCQYEAGLELAALLRLSDLRLAEALRCWLARSGLRSHAGQIDNLCRQLRAADPRQLRVELAGASLRCDGRLLQLKLSARCL